jgi:cell division protein FtsL
VSAAVGRARRSGDAPPRSTVVRRRSRSLIRRSSGTSFAPLALVSAICVAAVVFGVLLEQVILAQSAFKLARVRRQMAAAEARNQELTLEVTKLSSPSRIERYARTALGMVEPAQVSYIVAGVGSADRRVARHPGGEAYGAAGGVGAAAAAAAAD